MRLLFFLLLGLLGLATPAHADDISAAGRSVVRVVVIAFEDGEVANFGHGSGFAVAPRRIVTNAHVIASAGQGLEDIVIGVVPSEGTQSFRARLIATDSARDLALLELEEGSVPAMPLFAGRLDEGGEVFALGYPGNVDLATAQTAEDYITPIPPTRSEGIFSNERPINGISTLLHTADIARGHSGGPLLDPCGRVVGVNTLITRNQDGDSAFAFAVANRELEAFLQQARQPFSRAPSECVSMTDRLRQDREQAEDAARAREASAAARAAEARQRMAALVDDERENRLALAILLLVLSLLSFGSAGILVIKNRPRWAVPLGVLGLILLAGAIYVFLSRPSRADLGSSTVSEEEARDAPLAGANVCQLVPERSRVTVSSTAPVPLDWSESGCVNGRIQYAPTGDSWTRVLVPEAEQTVSVHEVRPIIGEFVVTRFLLGAGPMARLREMRSAVDTRACTSDSEAKTILADQQREIVSALPSVPNERLVYDCRPVRPPSSD